MAEYSLKQDPAAGLPAPNPPKQAPNYSEPSPTFETTFASLSLHRYDRLRLLQFPPSIVDLVRQTLRTSWTRGIQAEQLYAGSHEFKLRGNPWLCHQEESVHARRLMQQIFASLWNAGWLMSFSTDISKKKLDKDTLIFRQQVPPPPPCDWLSISFSRTDRIRLMDTPHDLQDAIIRELRPFIQDSRPYTSVPGVWEIKINGHPWMANGEETMTSRRLLLILVTVLERFGFTVYSSIDQKATQAENRSESDTWHCRRLQSWAPGIPVYHV